jgi:hypothetical protein
VIEENGRRKHVVPTPLSEIRDGDDDIHDSGKNSCFFHVDTCDLPFMGFKDASVLTSRVSRLVSGTE